ncbi:arginine repressor [Candidatus Arthromitus sp. SFB-mouse-Japan]|nr:Arginine pathway regulatory protein ArgR, repressor of arg regulon [Candidatus Arthromitus sp. SFB-mouse-NL]EGX28890.1 arginine repressor protein [Candidatus Arthromitus sp. SFB-mouse-NYU]EIA24389.1 Arginine repressor [Candidatus Arthromitus sp. SFB-2]EIA25636.1 Arginine repressor [Candidatus Arthromitus sp. SFB-4]EIA27839.1 Arginine repressor [Candidatus Arthromitus sp. SFB-co]EIA30707.1 Arginine repressor [Candidatus Arthromitus sp. SFB-mouse-SU]BAK56435.1 arginine repressor [Candidatus 
MIKNKRHEKIIDIITNKDIETQEELADELRSAGFDVTQATVSRDIKLLKLIKISTNSGSYKYGILNNQEFSEVTKVERYKNIIASSILSMEQIDKTLVIRTLPGAASVVGEVIDSLNIEDIAGNVAGDNTIFVMVRNENSIASIQEKINYLIKN